MKGLEIPGYDPRAMQTLALGLAVATRGADHNRSGAAEVDFSPRTDRRALGAHSAALAIETEDQAAILDSLILCRFLRNALEDFYEQSAEMLAAVTGWDVTAAELRRTARRIVTAKKLFNIRTGWTPAEDRLPDRFLQQPLSDDPCAGCQRRNSRRPSCRTISSRGWTAEGWIEDSLLSELDLLDMGAMEADSVLPSFSPQREDRAR